MAGYRIGVLKPRWRQEFAECQQAERRQPHCTYQKESSFARRNRETVTLPHNQAQLQTTEHWYPKIPPNDTRTSILQNNDSFLDICTLVYQRQSCFAVAERTTARITKIAIYSGMSSKKSLQTTIGVCIRSPGNCLV